MTAGRAQTIGSLLLAVAGLASGPAFAQVTGPASLGYNLTVLGSDSGGIAVVRAGDIFTVREGGLLGVPPDGLGCALTYKEGSWHKVSGLCSTLVKDTSSYFQPGMKVYVTKVDVNLKKEKVSLRLVACDECNDTYPPTYYKAELAVEFEKGYLETARPQAVREIIAQMIVRDSGGRQQRHDEPAPIQPPPPPEERPLPPVAPPPPPAAEPISIELGQTTEQVTASMGKPEKIVKLATKQIYYYKDLKVTFVNDKVTDVQ